jgi:hypothetical protein
MRIAVKYCMEEVQSGIVSAICSQCAKTRDSTFKPGRALELLGFICGFPGRFTLNMASSVLEASYCENPGEGNLVMLQGRPDIMAILLQFYAKKAQGKTFYAYGALHGRGFT